MRSRERGQVIPLVAVAVTMLLGAAVLAADVGYWRYQQRLAQIAADSAAIAGAAELNYPASNDVTAAAKRDSASNGFTDGTAGTTVVVNNGPSGGAYSGNTNAVEVIVSQPQPVFFDLIYGKSSQNVSARAVAILSAVGSPCITVLQGSLSGDLTLHGGGRGGITTSPPCGLQVNGNLDVTGQANVTVSYASYVGSGPKGGSYPYGQPIKSIPATDPCLRLAGCLYLLNLKTSHPELFSAACQDGSSGVLPANPIPPGRYCHGPYSRSPLTLQAGLFILDKGMFTGANVSGTSVTIYNNCTSNCDVTLSGGNANNTLVAPLTGNTAGMVYFQPASLQNSFTVNGASGTISEIGGVYAPNADFTFNGQLPSISFLVAGAITMNGGGLDAGTGTTSYPVPMNAVLAE